jgi:hypothetical protein
MKTAAFKPFRPKKAPTGTVGSFVPKIKTSGTLRRKSMPHGSLIRAMIKIIGKAHATGKKASALKRTSTLFSKFKAMITPNMIKRAHTAGMKAVLTPEQRRNTRLHDKLAKKGYWDPL